MRLSFFGKANRPSILVTVFVLLASIFANVAVSLQSAQATTVPVSVSQTAYSTTTSFAASSGKAVTCASAAKGLAWFVCTILDTMANALSGLYSLMEKSLQFNSDLLKIGSSSTGGVYKAWGYFRNIANIIFVIFLLVVILSQLTGFGIDNYGIKKSLPRLIVAAILVNASYYICLVFVDLSNILGVAIRELFIGLASGITLPTTGLFEDIGTVLSDVGGVATGVNIAGGLGLVGLISAGGGIGALLAGGAAAIPGILAVGAIAALIALLGAVVSAVTSLFAILVLLSARQSIIVIGTVVSPIAFVCYMLPNTKNVFDRWWKLMQGMLFLYPICGLVIGAGELASVVILSTGGGDADFLVVLTAMIAQIGPFFFIPSLLRGSFKAAGNLGGVVQGLGRRVGGWGQRQIREADVVRTNQEVAAGRRQKALDIARIRSAQRRAGMKVMSAQEAAENYRNYEAAEANRAVLSAQNKAREDEKFSDKDYIAGVAAKQTIEAAADLERTKKYGEMTLDANGEIRADIQNATIQQAVISQEGQINGTLLYDDVNYQNTKRGQQRNAIASETTKMYMDQFSTLDTAGLQARLTTAMRTTGPHQAQQISAAIQTLMSRGSEKEILETLSDTTSSTGLRDAMRADGNLRNLVSQQFLSSGNTIMKEYGKHIVTKGATANGFSEFVDGAAGTDSLADALRKKGSSALTGMNKDNLDFLSNHMAAVDGLDGKTLANAMAATSNGEEIHKFVNMVGQMSATQKTSIIQNMSAAQFVSTHDSIRRALGREIDFTNQINALRNPQNAQLAAQLSQADRAAYHI